MSFRVSWSSSTTRIARGCFTCNEGDSEIVGFVGVLGRIVVVEVSMVAGAPAEVSLPSGSDSVPDFTTGVPMFVSDKDMGGTVRDCSPGFDGQSSLASPSDRRSVRDGVISTRPSVKVISDVHRNKEHMNTRCSMIVRCVK